MMAQPTEANEITLDRLEGYSASDETRTDTEQEKRDNRDVSTPIKRIKLAYSGDDFKAVPSLIRKLVMLENILYHNASRDLIKEGDNDDIKTSAGNENNDSDDEGTPEDVAALDDSLEGIYQHISLERKEHHQLAGYFLASRAIANVQKKMEVDQSYGIWENVKIGKNDMPIDYITDGDQVHQMAFRFQGEAVYISEPSKDKLEAIRKFHTIIMRCIDVCNQWMETYPGASFRSYWTRPDDKKKKPPSISSNDSSD
jgi:hypothetical protein